MWTSKFIDVIFQWTLQLKILNWLFLFCQNVQLYWSYVDSFSFFLLCGEMDFVLEGTSEPRPLCVLPATEEGRRAEARTHHPREPGQPSHFQQRFPRSGGSGGKHLKHTLEIKSIKSLSPVFFRDHKNRNGHPPEVRTRENWSSFWHPRGGCSETPTPCCSPKQEIWALSRTCSFLTNFLLINTV